MDKILSLKAVKYRNASTVHEKIIEAEERLVALLAQLETQQQEIANARNEVDLPSESLLPLNNTRIALDLKINRDEEAEDSDEDDDDEVISRDAMKRQAQ